MSATDWTADLKKYAIDKLRQDCGQIERCAGLLDERAFWHRTNAHCNSVANLALHLTGNVGQWVLGGLGGQKIERDRPAEFAARDSSPPGPIVNTLEQTVVAACDVIEGLDESRLVARYRIQHYEVSGVTAVFHVVEHFAAHAAQIVHMTKALRDVDLSLYDQQGQKTSGKCP